jgi:hypothetical protein
MSQLLGLAGTIGMIIITLIIILGLISHDDDGGNALAAPRSNPNQTASEDDLWRHIGDMEEKLELHRKHITRMERRFRVAGVIVFALISAIVSLYALARNDWVPGFCFMAIALSFGIYGLVNVFSREKGRW